MGSFNLPKNMVVRGTIIFPIFPVTLQVKTFRLLFINNLGSHCYKRAGQGDANCGLS